MVGSTLLRQFWLQNGEWVLFQNHKVPTKRPCSLVSIPTIKLGILRSFARTRAFVCLHRWAGPWMQPMPLEGKGGAKNHLLRSTWLILGDVFCSGMDKHVSNESLFRRARRMLNVNFCNAATQTKFNSWHMKQRLGSLSLSGMHRGFSKLHSGWHGGKALNRIGPSNLQVSRNVGRLIHSIPLPGP